MKSKREGIGLHELKRQLSTGAIASVYFVVGEEAVLRDDAVAVVRAAVLGPDDANIGVFNSDAVYGDETDAAEILTLCANLPMFATRRLVVVKEVGALSTRESERLLPYLNSPVETTCLVLTGGKVDGRVKFFQALKQTAVIVDCAPLDARTLPAWVQDQAGALGLHLDEEARVLLIEASGGDLGVLCREMEKLAAYVAPNTRVTAADVEAVRGADAGGTVWDFLDALGRKDEAGALRALAQVLTAGEPPLRLLGLLASHWRQIWKAREQLARRVPEVGLARALGIHPFRVRGLVEQARTYSEGELGRCFNRFREADSRLKGSGGKSEKRVLESLVLAFCRGAGRATPSRPFASAR